MPPVLLLNGWLLGRKHGSAVDQHPDQSCQPSWELWCCRHQFRLCRVRELRPKNGKGTGRCLWPKPGKSTYGLARSFVP